MSETIKILSFKEALKQSHELDKSILLGNGFSIAWNHDIFSYKSLKEQAEHINENAAKVFSALNTFDFEEVIEAFTVSGKVCSALGIENNFSHEADKIRDLLIETIAANHPDFPDKISETQFNNCVNFLKNFNSKIYTINYDMLLYWVLIKDFFRDDHTNSLIKNLQDGFAYNDEEFLNWDGARFNVHYLHGALHLFEYDSVLKLNYAKTKESLKNQFIKLIKNQNKMPLFVAEGSSNKKLIRIHSSGYLTRCLNSLQKVGSKKKGSAFFTYGVSFSDNDKHILNALAKNNCSEFYVGLYGDLGSKSNKNTINNVNNLIQMRSKHKSHVPPKIFFYQAETANVW